VLIIYHHKFNIMNLMFEVYGNIENIVSEKQIIVVMVNCAQMITNYEVISKVN
jgi:hypothetical protein